MGLNYEKIIVDPELPYYDTLKDLLQKLDKNIPIEGKSITIVHNTNKMVFLKARKKRGKINIKYCMDWSDGPEIMESFNVTLK